MTYVRDELASSGKYMELGRSLPRGPLLRGRKHADHHPAECIPRKNPPHPPPPPPFLGGVPAAPNASRRPSGPNTEKCMEQLAGAQFVNLIRASGLTLPARLSPGGVPKIFSKTKKRQIYEVFQPEAGEA